MKRSRKIPVVALSILLGCSNDQLSLSDGSVPDDAPVGGQPDAADARQSDPAELDGGGDGQGPADAASGAADSGPSVITSMETVWERRVGSSGDAVFRKGSLLPDGSLLAISSYATWIRKLRPDGSVDDQFGEPWPGDPSRRTGVLDVPAMELWLTDPDHFLVSTGSDVGPVFTAVHAFRNADGTPSNAFGRLGRIVLPYAGTEDGEAVVAIDHDAAGRRLLALVVRTWQMIPGSGGSLPKAVGPRRVQVLAIDTATGLKTSRGTFTLPPWTGRRFPDRDQVSISRIFAQSDGSFVVVARETIDGLTPVRPNNIGSRWSTIRLAAGRPPSFQTLVEGDYGSFSPGMILHDDGGIRIYLSGAFEGFSESRDDGKLLQVSVAPLAGAITAETLGPGLRFYGDFTECQAVAVDPTRLVYAESSSDDRPIRFTSYPVSGPPASFSSDLPERCAESLTLAPSGIIYAGAWDTFQGNWYALVSKLEPVN